MRALLFWLLITSCSFAGLFNPFVGMMCYLAVAHSQLVGFIWHGDAGNYGLVLGGSVLVGYVLNGIRRSPPRLRGLLWIALLWAWIGLAAFQAFDTTIAIPKFVEFTKIFVLSALLLSLLNTSERIRTALLVIAGGLGFLGAKSTLTFIATAGQSRLKGPGALIGDENEYALAMNMGVALIYFLARDMSNRRMRNLMRCLSLACAITVIGTHSRSGLLGLIVVALIIVAFSKRKLLALPAVAVGSAILLLLMPNSAMDRYKTIQDADQKDESAIGRLQSWDTARRMVSAHPYFGVGPKNFVRVYTQYSNYFPRAPHNGYIALAAESGLPSCFFYVAMLGTSILAMRKIRSQFRRDGESASLCTYALAVQAALTATLVPNCFINRQDFDLIYHLVAIGAAISYIARARLRELIRQSRAAHVMVYETNTPTPSTTV